MIESTAIGSAWRAECRWCPHVVEPDYGALVFPHEEFPDTDDGQAAAERWTDEHWAANPGHSPTVTLIHRFTLTSDEHLDIRLLESLFAGGRTASPLDELVEAVQWARNVAYSELGIETHDDGPLAITSKWRPVGDPTRDTSRWTFPPAPGRVAQMPADWLFIGRLGPEGIV